MVNGFVSFEKELKELIGSIVKSSSLHGLWINTLSYLENCGARMIAACEHPTLVKEEMLKHAAEEFRHAHVSLAQDIGVESLTEQMHLAERRGSPYLLIMGRKEALEGSAILRNRKTQEQTILPLKGLAERLKAFA